MDAVLFFPAIALYEALETGNGTLAGRARRRAFPDGVAIAPGRIRITGARITPIAFADAPMLNTVGLHEPFALRVIIELDTDAGLVGLGETYADQTPLARLEAAAELPAAQPALVVVTKHSTHPCMAIA